MNIKALVILALCAMSVSVSACGMKRALTLPDDEEKSAKAEQKEQAMLSEDLASYQSIDVLKQ